MVRGCFCCCQSCTSLSKLWIRNGESLLLLLSKLCQVFLVGSYPPFLTILLVFVCHLLLSMFGLYFGCILQPASSC